MALDPLNTIGPSWRGYVSLRYLIIFGDSYSDVGYVYNKDKQSAIPSNEEPLGIKFPGITWAEPGMPNWVGHLITEYSPGVKLLVYDYAVGGDTIAGVRKQIQVDFLPRVGEKPSWAPWNAQDTLFMTWIGINDCGQIDRPDVPQKIEELFVEQENLYKGGARNFLFIDVPPIHRTPVGIAFSHIQPDFHRIYDVWNSTLRNRIPQFSAAHPDITVLLFSSWDTFTRVLDDPVAHGFSLEDISRSSGEIWVDHLHPSTKMHDWIAHDLSQYLTSQSAYTSTDMLGGEERA